MHIVLEEEEFTFFKWLKDLTNVCIPETMIEHYDMYLCVCNIYCMAILICNLRKQLCKLTHVTVITHDICPVKELNLGPKAVREKLAKCGKLTELRAKLAEFSQAKAKMEHDKKKQKEAINRKLAEETKLQLKKDDDEDQIKQ